MKRKDTFDAWPTVIANNGSVEFPELCDCVMIKGKLFQKRTDGEVRLQDIELWEKFDWEFSHWMGDNEVYCRVDTDGVYYLFLKTFGEESMLYSPRPQPADNIVTATFYRHDAPPSGESKLYRVK